MSRRIELDEDALVLRYSGLGALARLTTELRVPYAAIETVRVGLDSLPGMLAPRVGVTYAPLGTTRRGIFWTGGKRLFLDLADPRRAVVIELDGQTYDRVAVEPDTDPNELAAQLAERAALP